VIERDQILSGNCGVNFSKKISKFSERRLEASATRELKAHSGETGKTSILIVEDGSILPSGLLSDFAAGFDLQRRLEMP
jgi:hypothetical protein